jgi:pimeloyl-ACP methyl ester carboxylesterase
MANTVLPFEIAMDRLRASGYTIDHLIVSGRSGSDHNAEQIAETLSGVNLSKEEKLILIGHSKGAVDILHFLVNYPEQSKHVAAVISVAGAINGSPWADKLAGTYKTLGAKVKNSACEPGDGGALESLKRTTRLSWLAEHSLPRTVKFFSIAGFTDREGINRHLAVGYDQLKRIDPRNDGLLLFSDQIMPGATLLGYAHADHWEIVYPLEDKIPWAAKSDSNRPFPRGVLFESVILYVAETFNEEDSRNGSD